MFNDRICQIHNLPSMAIDLKNCKENNQGLLCAKCLTDRNDSDEVAHLYDIQQTIDDIVQLQISKQKQFTNYLISQMEELKNQLYQFQQSVNIIINKQIINIEQEKKELTKKLNHLENQGNVRNDSFYLEFLKNNYKGKYLLQCSNKLDKVNTNLMKNIKEGIEQIIKSDHKVKIYDQLNQIINECNQEEIITKKITQKINQKQKTITLSQDCPIHEQEITMIILDKKSDRNRLICIDCIEECQKQGLKQLYSIKKVNQIWKDSKGKLSQSLSEILSKSQQNVKKAQEILQQQNNKFNESTEQLQLQIGQSFIEIKTKQQQVDQENIQIYKNQKAKNYQILSPCQQMVSVKLNQFKQRIFKKKNRNNLLKKQKYIRWYYNNQKMNMINRFYQNMKNEIPQMKRWIFSMTLNSVKNILQITQLKSINRLYNSGRLQCRLSFFTQEIMNLNNHLKFNTKQLFYQTFINSSKELLQNKLYLNPNLNQINNIQDFFFLKKSIFYQFPECYTIINFSLSKVHSSFGKTQLINQTFYKSEDFEVNDNCDSNLHSVDIMFDFCFNGTRNLAIADVHGIIPIEVMIRILPLLKLCIIQMNSEDELKENYESFKRIKQNLQKGNQNVVSQQGTQKLKTIHNRVKLKSKLRMKEYRYIKQFDLTQKCLDRQQITLKLNNFSVRTRQNKQQCSLKIQFIQFIRLYSSIIKLLWKRSRNIRGQLIIRITNVSTTSIYQ